jgi:hypothetical protein
VLHENELWTVRPHMDAEGFVRYKNDDLLTEYLTYRLEVEPKSYADFFKGQKLKISTKYFTNETDYIITPSVSFLDEIEINKDYYYTFRCRDIHGHVSSLTDIYHIRFMGHEGGRFIPIIRTITNEELLQKQKEYYDKFKNFKRFLMIKPAYQQEVIDAKTNDFESKTSRSELLPTEYVLGITNNYVWGKQFRARMRSRHTGRVVDLIFKFTNTFNIDQGV